MSATKLLRVSATLYAMFMGAGHASAGPVHPLASPCISSKEEKAMSYRILISFAAAVIGMSCLATDASARGGSGSGGGKAGTVNQTKHVPGGVSPTATQGGAAAGARYYAPASYNSNAACGRYPYPPCKR
jgi:hypothetical protein